MSCVYLLLNWRIRLMSKFTFQFTSSVRINVYLPPEVHERLGKLVTVRSRPNAVKLITPAELSKLQLLINTLSKVIYSSISLFIIRSQSFSYSSTRSQRSAAYQHTLKGQLIINMFSKVR